MTVGMGRTYLYHDAQGWCNHSGKSTDLRKYLRRRLEPWWHRIAVDAYVRRGTFSPRPNKICPIDSRTSVVRSGGAETRRVSACETSMNATRRSTRAQVNRNPSSPPTNPETVHRICADYVMANPPFNVSDWWNEKLADDPRWEYGTPPQGNANFAWLQHMLYHLSPNGSLALLLANGSMSSQTSGEGEIRKALLENDLIECMVALPGQLFTNTQIPACIWFLTKNKTNGTKTPDGEGKGDRTGKVLFIDAREKGYMKDRVLRDFKTEEIKEIAKTLTHWQQGSEEYEDTPGYCKSTTLEEIRKNDYVLTPGRYVGAPETEDDGIPFSEKMEKLTTRLKGQFEESEALETKIKENLAGLGYEL